MQATQIEVKRKAFAEMRIRQIELGVLQGGQIRVRIDKFALTANNVTYALMGETIGYWQFFPADVPWGIVPVWGFADVVASACEGIELGDRLWGFFPMASHLTMQPVNIGTRQFVDGAPHRAGLPAIYNAYQRTSTDRDSLKSLEDMRCLVFPLFSTSYLLYDYLIDNQMFGASQVVIGSASSKTAYGLANLLYRGNPDQKQGARPKVIGLTSPQNMDYVQGLAVYDQVLSYADLIRLDPKIPTAFVDMAGNSAVVATIHGHFGPALKLSSAVGATHWNAERVARGDGTVRHEMFFAPAQFQKREAEWGQGEAMRRAYVESARMAGELAPLLKIEWAEGLEAAGAAFGRLVSNSAPPDVALMARL